MFKSSGIFSYLTMDGEGSGLDAKSSSSTLKRPLILLLASVPAAFALFWALLLDQPSDARSLWQIVLLLSPFLTVGLATLAVLMFPRTRTCGVLLSLVVFSFVLNVRCTQDGSLGTSL